MGRSCASLIVSSELGGDSIALGSFFIAGSGTLRLPDRNHSLTANLNLNPVRNESSLDAGGRMVTNAMALNVALQNRLSVLYCWFLYLIAKQCEKRYSTLHNFTKVPINR